MENVIVSFGHGATGEASYQPPDGGVCLPALVVDIGGPGGPAVYIRPDRFSSDKVTGEHVRFAYELVEAAVQYRDELVRALKHDRAMSDESEVRSVA